MNKVSATDLVKRAKVNRSTFYVNFIDIYDLADKLKEQIFQDLLDLYKEKEINQKHLYNYLKLLKRIKENQIYYNTLFKLNFDFMSYYDNRLEENDAIKYYGSTKNIEYHIEFFKAVMSVIIKKWLYSGCKESPEEMIQIIIQNIKEKVYKNKSRPFLIPFLN